MKKINQQRVIYGYKRLDGKIVIDEIEAEVIRLIFSMRENGFSLNRIVNYLIESNVMTRQGYIFRDCTILRIINNGRYYGNFETPAIIYS